MHSISYPASLSTLLVNFTFVCLRYRRKAKAARPGGNGMVNARGGIAEQLSYSPSNHNDEASENGHGNRNGSVRSSSLCMQNNGEYTELELH